MAITSTMMDRPLTTTMILRHGEAIHGDRTVTTWAPDGARRSSFAKVAARAGRLASALTALGVGPGSVVGTLSWNHQQHLEAYLAVPSMGAVLHTLNLRLSADQLAFVINDGEDEVLLVDADLLHLLEPVAASLAKVRAVLLIGEGDWAGSSLPVVGRYEDIVVAQPGSFAWPELDERTPAAICHTSGTTGDAKGVVYSHRSQVLYTLSLNAASNFGLTARDKVLVLVPLFHANAWGTPYGAWWAGSDILLPQRFLQPQHVVAMIEGERPTFSAGVPTLWNDLVNYRPEDKIDLSSLREVIAGGSAVTASLIARFDARFGVGLVQGWGMTESSPLAALARPDGGGRPADHVGKAGRVTPGIELRIVDDEGVSQAWDGAKTGEIEMRGPWVTGSYLGGRGADSFSDGWLRTGDVASIDPHGYIQIVDRAKDVIKSGGEWISSLELESVLASHPAVLEAAVIAIPDERWGERPLACVVARGAAPDPAQLQAHVRAQVPSWWAPESWCFIDSVPRTGVGKFDKKRLRDMHGRGELAAVRTRASPEK